MAFKNVLVEVDAQAARHPALELGADVLAPDGRLTVVDVIDEVPDRARSYLPEALEREIIAHRAERLGAALAQSRKHVRTASAVLRGNAAIALTREVLRHGHDLVVRAHGTRRDKPQPFGPIDMELLRKCPSPVWLIASQEEHQRPKRILAAVHPERADAVEQALNRRIVETALWVASRTRGSVTVLTCWQPFGLGLLESRMTESELAEAVLQAREQAETELEDFGQTMKDEIARCQVRLIRGDPQHVIPRYAARHGADLVVMGTVGRAGLLGMIMGNTAERILRALRCSVLALKPEGFASPVSLEP